MEAKKVCTRSQFIERNDVSRRGLFAIVFFKKLFFRLKKFFVYFRCTIFFGCIRLIVVHLYRPKHHRPIRPAKPK